jgi:NADH dehydrogenase [ubiquinone] 1 alpha subcomplex assembly factor 7
MERLDCFMARANAAYYARPDPLGGFTTSPEISQVFGEVLGAWSVVAWQAMGARADTVLVELGPGRGTLMTDVQRVLRRAAPSFGANVHLVEMSPSLRARQAEVVTDATWHDKLETAPERPMVLLANEFLDALPIRQCVRRADGWVERYVADGAIAEIPCPAPPTVDAADGGIVEWSDAARDLMREVAARVAVNGGVALFIDYGSERSAPGDSLQALRGGQAVDPLADPGTADLTAHVDFEALAGVARLAGAVVQGPVSQGVFLARLGLFERSRALSRGKPPHRVGALMEAAQRLAEPHLMGRLFKVMAICHPSLPQLPGFGT